MTSSSLLRRCGAPGLLVAIVATAHPAFADDEVAAQCAPSAPAPNPTLTTGPTEPVVERRWYGYQTLVVDGVASAIAFGGAAAQSGPAYLVGWGAMMLGAPIVHLANGRPLTALGSLGIRAGLFIVGAIVGFAASTQCEGEAKRPCLRKLDDAAVGGLVGLTGAIALDASVLSGTF